MLFTGNDSKHSFNKLRRLINNVYAKLGIDTITTIDGQILRLDEIYTRASERKIGYLGDTEDWPQFFRKPKKMPPTKSRIQDEELEEASAPGLEK